METKLGLGGLAICWVGHGCFHLCLSIVLCISHASKLLVVR
jgi:hypothetical protein